MVSLDGIASGMNESHETFYATGILFGHIEVDQKLLCAHGRAFWNYPNGKRLIDGYYTHGVRSGSWREFTEDGTILNTTELGDGEYNKSAPVPKLSSVHPTPETTILLEEEYGYRHWLWLPDRPLTALFDWWRSIFSVEPWNFNPRPLPGVLIESTGDDQLWHKLFDSRRYVSGHIHEDDDSELRSPSGEVYHHRGYGFTKENCTV